MPARNPDWTRDELILALDLYFRKPPSSLSSRSSEVIELSRILNALPIHRERPDLQRFRNPSGVYMKLCNFLRHDPDYTQDGKKGLSRGSKLEKEVWDEFSDDIPRLHQIAETIWRLIAVPAMLTSHDDEEENEFPEGRIMHRLHVFHERSREAVEHKKAEARKQGVLACIVCGFDPIQEYGVEYIECHHTIPVSKLTSDHKTKLNDLALLCPNCHRVLHKTGVTVEEMKVDWAKRHQLGRQRNWA